MILLLSFLAAVAAPPAPAEPELPAACAPSTLAADLHACDKAIGEEKDARLKARLLRSRAYALNEKASYEDALKDLDAALALDPDYVNALHERAYTYGELSDYARALKDLDREVALRPDGLGGYQERAFARHWSGDFVGALADRNREAALKPDDAGIVWARADEAAWLGRFDEARRDAAASEALAKAAKDDDGVREAQQLRQRIDLLSSPNPGGSPKARCRAADREGKFEQPHLIGDCTVAFLAARDNKAKAELLTIRGIAWLVGQQDQAASTSDERIAVALDPGNAVWHSNLGFSYVQGRHSWAADREFTKSLQIRESWTALAGRAQARYNLDRKDEAFADARRSTELHPNDVALTVLGDLAHDRNDDKSAKLYWMGAYHLGDRDDGLIGRLKSIGVDHPENEPAK